MSEKEEKTTFKIITRKVFGGDYSTDAILTGDKSKPTVSFCGLVGKDVKSAEVIFHSEDKDLVVAFKGSFINEVDYTVYASMYTVAGGIINDIAKDEKTLNFLKYNMASRGIRKYGIMGALPVVKFKGNGDSSNKMFAIARKQLISSFSDLRNEIDKQEKEQKLQKKQKNIETDRKVEKEASEFLALKPSFDVKENDVSNKLSTLRKKIAHGIDETLGTHLEEKKIAKPLKKIEKAVSDKLFGKVNE